MLDISASTAVVGMPVGYCASDTRFLHLAFYTCLNYEQPFHGPPFISHVSIRWANIERGREDNFAKYSRSEVSTLQLPYDTESILHYSSNAFSR